MRPSMIFVAILHLMKIWVFIILAFKQRFDKVNKKAKKMFIFKHKIYLTFNDLFDHNSFDENFCLHNDSIHLNLYEK